MNRILVIGAGGLVGSRFMEMVKDSYDVYGTFNSHQIKKENCFFLNAVNRKETFNLIAKVRPDLVIDTHSLNNVDFGTSGFSSILVMLPRPSNSGTATAWGAIPMPLAGTTTE